MLTVNEDLNVRGFLEFSDALDALRESKLSPAHANCEIVKIGIRTGLVAGVDSPEVIDELKPREVYICARKIMEYYVAQINPTEDQAEDQIKNS